MSPVQEKAKKLPRTRNLRLPQERMFPGNQPTPPPMPGSSALSSGEKE
jgi:hypothetical protein